MPNKNYLRGRRFEWQLKKDLEEQGYLVFRTAGSHGLFDLIGLDKNGKPLLIQCKVTKNDKNIKTLIKEFRKSLPFDWAAVDQRLAVKITGSKGYEFYT
jgi:Holliday junction resolvase